MFEERYFIRLVFCFSLTTSWCDQQLVSMGEHFWSAERLLVTAARRGDLGAAAMALDRGACIMKKDSQGYSALDYAARGGHARIVELFVTRCPGSCHSEHGRRSSTPLHYAAEGDQCHVIRLLLRNGASVCAIEEQHGDTPLHVAACYGFFKALGVLLGGSDAQEAVNRQNDNGDTPLHVAIRGRHVRMVARLLAAGASVFVANNDDQTPLDLAEAIGCGRRICAALRIAAQRECIQAPSLGVLPYISIIEGGTIVLEEGTTCYICFEEFRDEDTIAEPLISEERGAGIACGHYCHQACLSKWFTSQVQDDADEISFHDTCPACRQKSFPATMVIHQQPAPAPAPRQ